MNNEQYDVLAPLDGILLELSQVPDPVFAEKMIGDGYAIDPISNIIKSPVQGKVCQLHKNKHAVAIRTKNGEEILIHVGIDTVRLNGKGFKSLVVLEEEVSIGTPLIEFDIDFLALHSKSLITPVVLINGEQKNKIIKTSTIGLNISCGTPLFSFEKFGVSFENEIDKEEFISDLVRVRSPLGFHARPAAKVVEIASKASGEVVIQKGVLKANAKSIVAILNLEVIQGDELNIHVAGEGKENVLQEVKEYIQNLYEPLYSNKVETIKIKRNDIQKISTGVYRGVCASDGVSVGKIFILKRDQFEIPSSPGVPGQEMEAINNAITVARLELEKIRSTLLLTGNKSQSAIFQVHLELLNDPGIVELYKNEIYKNKNAAQAWSYAYHSVAEGFKKLKSEMMRERASDIEDVGMRVLKKLIPHQNLSSPLEEIPHESILVAEDLTPSDTAQLDSNKVKGFVTTTGGGTSHVSILARSLGIPAIAGIDSDVLSLENELEVLLDATNGVLKTQYTDGEKQAVLLIRSKMEEDYKNALKFARKPAVTTDGRLIEVAANIANIHDAKKATQLGCDGVGLLRTEFLFQDKLTAPTVKEQAYYYEEIAKLIGKKNPLIIRTLDVGGDKPLHYLLIEHEENPFLGQRGIRVSLENPVIFKEQIRAILQVSERGNIHIMFPMISNLKELLIAKKILNEEEVLLGKQGEVKIGIMVEVPAVALMAHIFAPHVDFFSIGANDLTQYTVAVDRGHKLLAKNADGLNPAVLRLIQMTCEAAKQNGIWVGVCGGIASELPAVPILIGLGVKELSVSIPMIPRVKECIRKISYKEAVQLATQALNMSSADEVRKFAQRIL